MSGELSKIVPSGVKQTGSGEPNSVQQNDPQMLEVITKQISSSGIRTEQATIAARRVMSVVTQIHSGPLPPVSDFSGYEMVCPGAARDILEMAKKQQSHENSVEKIDALGSIGLMALGILSAVLVVAGTIGAAIYAALNGHTALAIVLGSGTGLAALAGVFLRRRTEPKSADTPKQKQKNKKR